MDKLSGSTATDACDAFAYEPGHNDPAAPDVRYCGNCGFTEALHYLEQTVQGDVYRDAWAVIHAVEVADADDDDQSLDVDAILKAADALSESLTNAHADEYLAARGYNCHICGEPFGGSHDDRKCQREHDGEPVQRDVSAIAHSVTVPASPATVARFHASNPMLTAECVGDGCGWAAGAGTYEGIGRLVADHVDPEARAKSEAQARSFSDFLASEDDRFKPLTDALNAYAPLFPEVQHTGGGCMAIMVRLGEPEKRDDVAVITELDGPWTVSFWPSEDKWNEPDDFEPTYLELAEGTPMPEVADAVVAEFVKRGILTAPVAREE